MNSLQRFNLLIGALWGEADTVLMMHDCIATNDRGDELLIGVDRKGQRLTLAPVDESFSFTPQTGAALVLTEWRDPSTEQRHLAIVCSSEDLAEVFSSFTDDLATRVTAGTAPTEAMLHGIKDWKNLFKPARELTKEAARGLFGELWLVAQLAKRNPHVAVERWTGPDGAPHDFMSADQHLEVKTSESEGMNIIVSSLAQLDAVDSVPLALTRIRVLSQPEGKNIRDMVDDLVGLGCHRPELLQKLTDSGFMLGSDPDTHHFSIINEPTTWEISEDFPGLRSRDIPDSRREAISSVKYGLDLLAAPGRIENPEDLERIFDRLVSQ